jgi:hypothetical protein
LTFREILAKSKSFQIKKKVNLEEGLSGVVHGGAVSADAAAGVPGSIPGPGQTCVQSGKGGSFL